MSERNKNLRTITIIVSVLAVLLAISLGFVVYKYQFLTKDLNNTKTELLDTSSRLNGMTEQKDYLLSLLALEQAKNGQFESQIKEILGTVNVLDKLSKTDEELLQKYSRVYFLNEHYVPSSLATITPEYLYEKNREQYIHKNVLPHLLEMLNAARKNDTPISIISAYRSFREQSSVKGKYLTTYGTGANQFSADQGYSEHQLGTALDLTTEKLGSSFTNFADTKAYEWMIENAYKYGFILSYTEDNSYYQFEPWHWRFVGKKLALRLHSENEHFYDLDQRIINNYLVSIFD